MSKNKNYTASLLWFNTAEDDFDTACELIKLKKYAASCFHFQQALEKAFKALYIRYDLDPWGHSVFKLLSTLQTLHPSIYTKFQDMRDDTKTIDRFYIPTRYPDSLPDITPMEAFTLKDSEEAYRISKKIFVIITEEFK